MMRKLTQHVLSVLVYALSVFSYGINSDVCTGGHASCSPFVAFRESPRDLPAPSAFCLSCRNADALGGVSYCFADSVVVVLK